MYPSILSPSDQTVTPHHRNNLKTLSRLDCTLTHPAHRRLHITCAAPISRADIPGGRGDGMGRLGALKLRTPERAKSGVWEPRLRKRSYGSPATETQLSKLRSFDKLTTPSSELRASPSHAEDRCRLRYVSDEIRLSLENTENIEDLQLTYGLFAGWIRQYSTATVTATVIGMLPFRNRHGLAPGADTTVHAKVWRVLRLEFDSRATGIGRILLFRNLCELAPKAHNCPHAVVSTSIFSGEASFVGICRVAAEWVMEMAVRRRICGVKVRHWHVSLAAGRKIYRSSSL
ncbi:hypothetical protein BZA05DRAFT_147510 [Tricharina praecox]|uniref:uncharacterized protein n=1 Tax=Tricharina praecox TaxID=43433 RepID=UPI00221F0A0F|nr:uncharacterized protein BZA05DRAFT_147510 [Tricharina praecox]KAI5845564.1 hypothetical protein BZA05DRAFT_147510 [Tricharina praecox]